MTSTWLSSLEICAGAGGQALGLEWAGFDHLGVVENDSMACETLRVNRWNWNVIEEDLRVFDAKEYRGVDLLAGGVPCPPFSIAGKRLGKSDERDLFPTAIRLIEETRPKAVMFENVPGLAVARFTPYRAYLTSALSRLGYESEWRILNACEFGVPQLRPRFVMVALPPKLFARFRWPTITVRPPTVGEVLGEEMASNGWRGAAPWATRAAGIAPTLVGGSKKHGGPDLGPTRTKQAWLKLGVDGKAVANEPPSTTFPVSAFPRLTVRMAAMLQGFPTEWTIEGKKTPAYRQVGNAFPPPVAAALGRSLHAAILRRGAHRSYRRHADCTPAY